MLILKTQKDAVFVCGFAHLSDSDRSTRGSPPLPAPASPSSHQPATLQNPLIAVSATAISATLIARAALAASTIYSFRSVGMW